MQLIQEKMANSSVENLLQLLSLSINVIYWMNN